MMLAGKVLIFLKIHGIIILVHSEFYGDMVMDNDNCIGDGVHLIASDKVGFNKCSFTILVKT